MRTRSAQALLAAALALLAPSFAAGVEWDGRLGLGYDRIENWSPGMYTLAPTLRLDGNLGARGFFVDPGVVDWNGRVGYDNTRSTYATSSNTTLGLSYGAAIGILQTRESRAQVSANASRSRSDYATDLQASRTTGSALTDTYSVSASSAIPGLPAVAAGFSYRDLLQSGFDQPDTRETTKQLDLGTQFGQAGLSARVNYGALWNTGTLAPVNYTSQQVSISAAMTPADRVFSSLDASYYVREPTALAALNPRYDNSHVNALAGWGDPRGTRAWGQYVYDHASSTDPVLEMREVLRNVGSANFAQRVTPDWELIETAAGSVSQTRLGPAQTTASGQAVGLTVNYIRPVGSASLGVRVGALEPETGSAQLAYGATASGQRNWQGGLRTYSLGYTVNYDQNLDATAGWSSNQILTAAVTNAATTFFSWTAQLQATGMRGGGGAFGANAQRNVTAKWAASYKRAGLALEAGLSDALTGALSNPVTDGLFIPAAYDTHSRYAGANLTIPIARQLDFGAFTKFTVLSGPATPDQREALFGGLVAYTVGYWSLSLDERYTVGGAAAYDHRVNVLYVRLSRAFGGR